MPARKLAEIHLASADWFAENVREMMPAARQLLAAGLDSCERGVENLVEDSVKKIAWQKAKQIMRSHGGNNPDWRISAASVAIAFGLARVNASSTRDVPVRPSSIPPPAQRQASSPMPRCISPDALTEIHMASSLQGFFLGVAYGQCLTPEALRLPTAKGGAR